MLQRVEAHSRLDKEEGFVVELENDGTFFLIVNIEDFFREKLSLELGHHCSDIEAIESLLHIACASEIQ